MPGGFVRTASIRPGDSAGGYIDNNGIAGWTDSTVCFEVWFGNGPRGITYIDNRERSRRQNPIKRRRGTRAPAWEQTVPRGNARSRNRERYGPFSFTLRDTGYQRIRIWAVRRTGPAYADIPAIVVEGRVAGRMAYVPNNEGNFFHWGRRGPSVHLNYPLPEGFDAGWFYNELNVPPGQDVQGSYFMACGFAQGYFGMQVNSPTERHILFSVWSPFETDDPAAIPDSQRIRLLDKGAGVHTGAFGNEGAGGQSYLDYPWKAGNTYGFLLHARRPETGIRFLLRGGTRRKMDDWRLIASFSRPQTSTGLTSLYSFLENFEPEEGDRNRYVLFNHGWAGDSTGHWVSLQRARFTVDNTGRKGYRMDYGGGVRNGSFYLENDGFFNGYTPAGIWLDREPDPGDRGPDIALPR